MSTEVAKTEPLPPRDVVAEFGNQYGILPNNVFDVMRQQSRFKDFTPPELVTVLAISVEHGLNPLLGHICFFKTSRGLSHYVEIAGWNHFMNRSPDYAGDTVVMNEPPEEKVDFFREWLAENTLVTSPESVPWSATCTMHRKDREIPTVTEELFIEAYRRTFARQSSADWKAKKPKTQIEGSWDTNPTRRIRHKARQQASRECLGLAIPDKEEAMDAAERILYPDHTWKETTTPGNQGLVESLEERAGREQEAPDDVADSDPGPGAGGDSGGSHGPSAATEEDQAPRPETDEASGDEIPEDLGEPPPPRKNLKPDGEAPGLFTD